MTFDFAALRKLFDETKTFLLSPRKVNAVIPALVVFAIWSVAATYSQALNVPTLESGEARVLWLLATTIVPLFLVTFASKAVQRLPKGFFWPISYLLVITTAGLPLFVFWLTHLNLPLSSILIFYVRLVVIISISESIVGFLIRRTDDRAAELEAHQISLVTHEDEFRKSVFEYLHDQVQTRLFAVGVQLNQVKRGLTGESSKLVETVILEIEKIRQKDIKTLGVTLNPPIATFGLIASLRDLVVTNNSVCDVTFVDLLQVPLSKAQEEALGVGIYRIVEQSIINALVHGHATEIEVSLGRRNSKIELQVSNNGVGLKPGKLLPGHGFSVIDGWVSKLLGRWNISEVKGRVTLTAVFP